MKTRAEYSGGTLSIIIDDHITGIIEVVQIKDIFKSYPEARIVELDIRDAYVIPSMLIGYLLKEINVDKKRIIIKCAKKELKNLITDLNLHTIIDVR